MTKRAALAAWSTGALLATALWLPNVAAAQASPGAPPPELVAAQPGLALHGRGTMTFWGMAIYDARLWATPGFELAQYSRQPFALEILYRKSLYGKQIANSSLLEMKRQPPFAAERADAWLARMTQLFPDVKPGDRITGLHLPGVGARFAVNGQWAGEVADPAFSALFFGIWLSPQTSEPALRCALAVCP